MSNKEFFKEAPKIVTKDGRYFLRFRYCENECYSHLFFTMAFSKIKGDKLIFYIPTTTSSGNLKGKLQFEEVTTQGKIKLIKENSIFWEEPGGGLVPLTIEDMKENIDVAEKSSIRARH